MITIIRRSEEEIVLSSGDITIYEGDNLEHAEGLKIELEASINDRAAFRSILDREALPPHWSFQLMQTLPKVDWVCSYCEQVISSATEPFMCRCGCTVIWQKRS